MTETDQNPVVLDVWQRRGLLDAQPNPEQKIDYVSELTAALPGPTKTRPLSLRIRYIPDRLVLEPQKLETYLDHVAGGEWETLEAFTSLVLNDLSNELVARWVEVRTSVPQGGDRLTDHVILMQDRQPGWDNPGLLSRLDP